MTLIKEEYNSFEELNPTILNGFIGTEIIRRLIGLTIAFKMDLKTKESVTVVCSRFNFRIIDFRSIVQILKLTRLDV
jgi:hypothetical protein